MGYRLTRRAEEQADQILLEGAEAWGVEAAARYNRLILAVWAALGADPALRGSRIVARVPGVRAYPLRLGRRLVEPAAERVGKPRHVVVYRVAEDGDVEILGMAHERMLLPRQARRLLK